MGGKKATCVIKLSQRLNVWEGFKIGDIMVYLKKKLWLDNVNSGVVDAFHDHVHDIRIHSCFKVTRCDQPGEKLPQCGFSMF